MKYKNKLKQLETKRKWWDTLKDKTGFTKPGSQKKSF